jgi:hypothetical protein
MILMQSVATQCELHVNVCEKTFVTQQLCAFDTAFGAEKDDQLAMQARLRVTGDFRGSLHHKLW